MAFWLVSAARGTGVLFVGAVITLLCTFTITLIHSDGFSFRAIYASFPPAIVWSIIGLLATCFVSIPIATLVTGMTRIVYRRITAAPAVSEEQ